MNELWWIEQWQAEQITLRVQLWRGVERWWVEKEGYAWFFNVGNNRAQSCADGKNPIVWGRLKMGKLEERWVESPANVLWLASHRLRNECKRSGEDRSAAIGGLLDWIIEGEEKSLFPLMHSHQLRVRGIWKEIRRRTVRIWSTPCWEWE